MAHSQAGPSNSRNRNPFQASPSPSPLPSSPQADFDFPFHNSLRLPPINTNSYPPNNEDYYNLPSIESSHFFDALPPPPLYPNSNANTSPPQIPPPAFSAAPNDTISHHLQPPPPPSNKQQASLDLPIPNPRQSEYAYNNRDFEDSPDPFSDFIIPLSSPAARSRPLTPTRANTAPVVDLTSSPPQMAPRKRKAEELGESSAPKRELRRSTRTPAPRSSQDAVEVVDLEKVDGKKEYEDFRAKEQAEQILKQNVDESSRPVRLADFQCIICMDNPTDLMVTHCGHLFCSECLHSALNAGDKKCCPVCRTAIVSARPGGGKTSKHGAFPLEMKLMTANKKGKQAAR